MNINEIIKLIDEKKLAELGSLHKVDKVNNKITGNFILKSFVRTVLVGRSVSLRSLEAICNSNRDLSNLLKAKDPSKKTIDHSAVGKRLETINVGFFQAIYEDLVEKYNNKFTKAEVNKFHRFDSTLIALSGKLLQDGLNCGGGGDERHIKMSFGLKNLIPSSVRFCTSQSEANENIALVKAINEAKIEKEDIILFDRGISKSDAFKDFDSAGKNFITRVNFNRKCLVIKELKLLPSNETDLRIISDEIVNLYNKKNQKISTNLRMIKAKTGVGRELCFLTNILNLNAYDIAQTYKKRWDIEVFFKFVKQHLQLKHFVSHNNNGMKLYIYCILIAAILFTIFKIINKLSGFKIALLKFTLTLEKEMIKDIVLFCGGNPELVELKL